MTERLIRHFAQISFLSLLLMNLWGCAQQDANSRALTQIDSLLTQNHYVEALEKLKVIQPDELNRGDCALYSLLITQAQYKNYEPITSDSVINMAVDYYRHSNEREKATRAQLYQGCVNEVMGKEEKAVDCYKNAVEMAEKQDLANKAYANLRLGTLYHKNAVGALYFSLDKYLEALRLYQELGDKHYELLCLTNIGTLYRNFKEEEKQDSALIFLDSAIKLATDLNDRYFMFENTFLKAEYYEIRKHDYRVAKDLAVQAIERGGNEIDHPRAHYCAAKSFVKLGQIDSARYYLNHAPRQTTARDSIMYYSLLADLAQFNHDNESWLSNHSKKLSMADSILIKSLNVKLYAIEKEYDLQQKELKNVLLRSKLKGAWLTIAVALLAAVTLFHLVWRYRSKLREKENEFELLQSDLNTSLLSLEQMQTTINNHEGRLKETEIGYSAELERQKALVSSLTEKINDNQSILDHEEQERQRLSQQIAALETQKAQSNEIKTAINGQMKVVHELIRLSHELDAEKFVNKFETMMSVADNRQTVTYWSNLRILINELYNNILDDASRLANGKLLESDINFIALMCCGYSRTAIMICMKFKNAASVSNKKSKIAKKMGVKTLDGFVQSYREKCDLMGPIRHKPA